ncbi:MAG: hemerythrin domain-containing protein [Acidobacteria bacterium]|nr:hemerythrin domain-containing protein [Acidobacteriota bacterium]
MLRAQHEEMEVTLAKLLETDRLYTVQDLLLRVMDLMADHFAREEEVLYPAAERLLGEGALTELGTRWAERRGVTVRTSQSGQ